MLATLTVADAVSLVRKNLDEVDPNGSVMYSSDNEDNSSIDDIISRNVPEAINQTHLAAPVQLLAGKDAIGNKLIAPDGLVVSNDGVLSFSLSEADFLRLVAFQAADSDIVVTDMIPEASAEGRKQLNKYIRGTFDRPRLVRLQDAGTSPAFRYYTLSEPSKYKDNPVDAISQFSLVQVQAYGETATSYHISPLLRQNITDYLTGMVMETYSDQRAQFFFQRANNFNV